jgi:hypothetical protein
MQEFELSSHPVVVLGAEESPLYIRGTLCSLLQLVDETGGDGLSGMASPYKVPGRGFDPQA